MRPVEVVISVGVVAFTVLRLCSVAEASPAAGQPGPTAARRAPARTAPAPAIEAIPEGCARNADFDADENIVDRRRGALSDDEGRGVVYRARACVLPAAWAVGPRRSAGHCARSRSAVCIFAQYGV